MHWTESLLFSLILISRVKQCFATETFIVSFQSSLKGSMSPSTDHWIEYIKPVPASKEFTACNWMKVHYFSIDIAIVLWSYCTNDPIHDIMNCTGIVLRNKRGTANRHLEANGYFPWSKHTSMKATAEIRPYKHRSWNHFCWSFSAATGKSKMYYNGNLINTQSFEMEEKFTPIGKPEHTLEEAFIFGQEPDVMKGNYDPLETFIGDLSELNIWGSTINDNIISSMASCQEYERGDLVSWDRNHFKINKAILHERTDLKPFCNTVQRIIIFPPKKHFPDAKKTCEIHGGKLVVPKSDKEQEAIMRLLQKFQCAQKTKDAISKMAWLGANKIGEKWYELGDNNGSARNALSYTKWGVNGSFSSARECSYIQSDGLWNAGKYATCNKAKLCTVCTVKDTPVFTLKGIWQRSDIDWNYYMGVDDSHKLSFYEGYKLTNIIYKDGTWAIVMKEGQDPNIKVELPGSILIESPLGRHEWSVTDPNCGMKEEKRNLTLSVCDYSREFTCYSGKCIEMEMRCDETMDCPDGSDEEDCQLVLIPKQYKKSRPPSTKSHDTRTLSIDIKMVILSVDVIDTVKMVVGLTIKIDMGWYDGRLLFANPVVNESNVIPDETSNKIWLPMENIIHENAIIGEIKQDDTKVTSFESIFAQTMDAERTEEDLMFNGSYNPLRMSQRFSIKYNCIFNVTKFPFDKGICWFKMMIKDQKFIAVTFKEDGSIIYNGPKIVGQFGIGRMSTIVDGTNYTFTIALNRNFTNQVLNMFIPTFILWLLAYSTLFMDIEHTGDRIMVSVTSLLVLAALLNTINHDLPKTSYIKLVDIWFVYHIVSIFQFIVYNIVLDSKTTASTTLPEDNNIVTRFNPSISNEAVGMMEQKMNISKKTINKFVIVLTLVLNCICYIMYLYCTL